LVRIVVTHYITTIVFCYNGKISTCTDRRTEWWRMGWNGGWGWGLIVFSILGGNRTSTR